LVGYGLVAGFEAAAACLAGAGLVAFLGASVVASGDGFAAASEAMEEATALVGGAVLVSARGALAVVTTLAEAGAAVLTTTVFAGVVLATTAAVVLA